MLTAQHIEEGLNRAYVQAIASKAGVINSYPDFDYKEDGTLSQVQIFDGKPAPTGYKISYQLKATINWKMDGNNIIYDLDAETYNHFVRRASLPRAVPLVLIVLCLPSNSDEWLENSEENLLLRKCCYWTSVTDMSGVLTSNSYTVRLRVPRSQAFTPNSLQYLFDLVEQGKLYG